MLRRAHKIGSTLLALLAAAASTAAAETGSVDFVWTRAPGAEACPDGKTMRVAVVQRLGRDPFQGVDAPSTRRIEATVSREGAAFHGRIRLVGRSARELGVRDFETPSKTCDDLAALMALAIGLAVDAELPEGRASEAPDAAPVSPGAPETPPAAAPKKPEVPATSDDAPVTFRGEPSTLGIRGGVLGGVVARPSAVAMVDGRLRVSSLLSARASLLWAPPRTSADGGYAIGLTAASLGPCIEFRRGLGNGVGACGALAVGAMQTVGNAAAISSHQDLWTALEVSTFADLAFARLWVAEASLSAYIPFSRSEVSSDGIPLFREASIGAAASLGLARSFF